jgi:hypothetical protein
MPRITRHPKKRVGLAGTGRLDGTFAKVASSKEDLALLLKNPTTFLRSRGIAFPRDVKLTVKYEVNASTVNPRRLFCYTVEEWKIVGGKPRHSTRTVCIPAVAV